MTTKMTSARRIVESRCAITIEVLPTIRRSSASKTSFSAAADGFAFRWDPITQPAHFPQDTTANLSVDLGACYNNVDTQKQGYKNIAAAWKPSLSLDLASGRADEQMIFGGMYDVSSSRYFWADNIGITPMILKASPQSDFQFTVSFESAAAPKW